MKHLKIIGLAAIAAMAFMAFAASASADVLCKTAPNKSGECETAVGDYASGTVFTSESTNAKLTVEGGITSYVTCSKSNVSLKNTSTGSNTSGTAVAGEVTKVSWSGCQTAGGSSCNVSESSGYSGNVKATSDAGAGTVTVNGNATTTVDCTSFGFEFKCTYKPTSGGLDLTLTGGNPASITATSQPLTLEAGGFGCGSGAKWDATYTLTGSNSALWVATKNA
ncbi:MAG TPA: hypothetical protein VNC15_07410 [Solirubrobacterales bacterium]|jgi:hypothetical protein|nr:hypothetical protein [Solirubrobacterales bacterium]